MSNPYIGDEIVDKELPITEPVVGFKQVFLDPVSKTIISPFVNKAWEPGEVRRAKCTAYEFIGMPGPIKGRFHKAPHKDCTCGLYSYSEIPLIIPRGAEGTPLVVIITQSWGKTRVYDGGFRSEFSKIIGIVEVKSQSIFGIFEKDSSVLEKIVPFTDLQEAVSKRYNVPLLSAMSAYVYASEYGKLFTKEDTERYEREHQIDESNRIKRAPYIIAIFLIIYLSLWLVQPFRSVYHFEQDILDGVLLVLITIPTMAFHFYLFYKPITMIVKNASLLGKKKKAKETE